jgi:hypothetical protein
MLRPPLSVAAPPGTVLIVDADPVLTLMIFENFVGNYCNFLRLFGALQVSTPLSVMTWICSLDTLVTVAERYSLSTHCVSCGHVAGFLIRLVIHTLSPLAMPFTLLAGVIARSLCCCCGPRTRCFACFAFAASSFVNTAAERTLSLSSSAVRSSIRSSSIRFFSRNIVVITISQARTDNKPHERLIGYLVGTET